MNYAIETLEREVYLIEKCLSEWDGEQYPEAKKERVKRLWDLEAAIRVINKDINKVILRNETK